MAAGDKATKEEIMAMDDDELNKYVEQRKRYGRSDVTAQREISRRDGSEPLRVAKQARSIAIAAAVITVIGIIISWYLRP